MVHTFQPRRVAQNESFITKAVYLGSSTMVPTRGKIFNFGLCESLKIELYRTFYSHKLCLESWMSSCIVQKQSFADELQNRCSYRFRKFYRKTAVLESLFNKNAGVSPPTLLKRDSYTAIFLWNLRNF